MCVCSVIVLAGLAITAIGSSVANSNTFYNVSVIHVTSYGEHLDTFGARSMLDCTRKCSETTSCRSAMFDVEQKLCSTNRGWMDPTAIVSCNQGDGCPPSAVRKYAKRYVKTTMRQPCNHDYRCVDPMSECRLRACACVPGYSFNSSTYQCVSACSQYGAAFQQKLGKRLLDNNDESHVVSSREDCEELCVMATSHVCRTMEFYPNKTSNRNCFLSSITAVTRPDLYLDKPGCDMYTRDCL